MNPDHLALLKRGRDKWHHARPERPDLAGLQTEDCPAGQTADAKRSLAGYDLSGATLTASRLLSVDLSGAILRKAKLDSSYLYECRLVGTDLTDASLYETHLGSANLTDAVCERARFARGYLGWALFKNANLHGASFLECDLGAADLRGVDLTKTEFLKPSFFNARLDGARLTGCNLAAADLENANFEGADLSHANLQSAIIVRTKLQGANLHGCQVFGASIWDPIGTPADSTDLVVTPTDDAPVTVDDLEIAQLVYLLLNNDRLRTIIDTLGRKQVLLLGRFGDRLPVLDALKQSLRSHGFMPVVFDFEAPRSRDLTETVHILASLSAFVIADLTSPRSIPLELQAIVPTLMLPIRPIIQYPEQPFSMLADLTKYHWMMSVLSYHTVAELCQVLDEAIIGPALTLRSQLLAQRAATLAVEDAASFVSRPTTKP